MKRICMMIGICCVTIPIFISCQVDHYFLTKCVFKNDTDSEITLECFFGLDSNKAWETIVIQPNDENYISFESSGGFIDLPFGSYRKLVINNGTYLVIQIRDDTKCEGLYDINNYIHMESKYGYQKYLYTFTDDFFKDGEPLEK